MSVYFRNLLILDDAEREEKYMSDLKRTKNLTIYELCISNLFKLFLLRPSDRKITDSMYRKIAHIFDDINHRLRPISSHSKYCKPNRPMMLAGWFHKGNQHITTETANSIDIITEIIFRLKCINTLNFNGINMNAELSFFNVLSHNLLFIENRQQLLTSNDTTPPVNNKRKNDDEISESNKRQKTNDQMLRSHTLLRVDFYPTFQIKNEMTCSSEILEDINNNKTPYALMDFLMFDTELKLLRVQTYIYDKNASPSKSFFADEGITVVMMSDKKYFIRRKDINLYADFLGNDANKHIISSIQKVSAENSTIYVEMMTFIP